MPPWAAGVPNVTPHEPVPGIVSTHRPRIASAVGTISVARAGTGTGGPAARRSNRLLFTVSPQPVSANASVTAAKRHDEEATRTGSIDAISPRRD